MGNIGQDVGEGDNSGGKRHDDEHETDKSAKVWKSDVAECPDIQQQHEGWIQGGGSPPPYSAEWWAEIAYPGLYFHIIAGF